nr:MAG TPA: hypothetical protein [Caudoviricetes sp.]
MYYQLATSIKKILYKTLKGIFHVVGKGKCLSLLGGKFKVPPHSPRRQNKTQYYF